MEIVQSIFSLVLNIGIVLGILLGALLIMLYFAQNSLIYLPAFQGSPQSPNDNMVGLKNPQERRLPYEDVTINTLDGQQLKGWILKQPNSKTTPTVIFFHENSGNIGMRLQYLEHYYNRVLCNILIVAYRGYSDSTGKPTENGLMLDGEAVVNHAFKRNDIDTDRIYIHGRSLGGAVSIYVMTQNVATRVAGVIIENSFTSLGDMAEILFPKLRLFKNLILRNDWPSATRIKQIRQPILFVYSMKDEIVPVSMMVQLQDKASNAKFINKFVVEDGDHNSNWAMDIAGYFTAIKEFIEERECK